MAKKILVVSVFALFVLNIHAQADRWQQRVEYVMDIDFDVKTHQFKGKQQLRYFNNSPDTLHRIFYHLYFNAFQPGSNMDLRNQVLPDPDPRVKGRIPKLSAEEMGWHKVNSLSLNGKPCQYEVNETILEVQLPQPILPKSEVTLLMDFTSQVPIQIRRSGRDNKDGIAYSMAQWYPKLCEYDYQGWHANPYVGREFYGVWGDFVVNISIDKKYLLGASGVLQNGGEIGYGYEPAGTAVRWGAGEKLTWKWEAKNVHDFMWTADPDYKHVVKQRKDGLVMHFLYEDKEELRKTWERAPDVMDAVFDYMNAHFGQYPYASYAFIEGGDGGMEYPMATLLAGRAGLGTFIHEMVHAWYYGILGTNESLYGWMDEGFTEYATSEVENFLKQKKLLGGEPEKNPHASANESLIGFNQSGREEPLSTHADHFTTNAAYGVGAYVKGHVFLTQLQYIMGKPSFDRAMLRYFDTWKYKHPNPNDFIRIMEKESGLELDWFKEYFVYTTKTVDYAVESVEKLNRKETKVSLTCNGLMPMPLDVTVLYKNGDREIFNIPLDIMRGAKPSEFGNAKYTLLPDWRWAHPIYQLVVPESIRQIDKIEIDASMRLVDSNRENNSWLKEGNSEKEENEGKND